MGMVYVCLWVYVLLILYITYVQYVLHGGFVTYNSVLHNCCNMDTHGLPDI